MACGLHVQSTAMPHIASAGALHLGRPAARLLPVAAKHRLQLLAGVWPPGRLGKLLLGDRRCRSCSTVLLQLAQRLAALLVVLQALGTGAGGG